MKRSQIKASFNRNRKAREQFTKYECSKCGSKYHRAKDARECCGRKGVGV